MAAVILQMMESVHSKFSKVSLFQQTESINHSIAHHDDKVWLKPIYTYTFELVRDIEQLLQKEVNFCFAYH